jgi:hypothetical protein
VNRVYQLAGRILDASDVIRHYTEAARATRGSQPSGSLFCGRRRHFRKPSLSTDKFKLKVKNHKQKDGRLNPAQTNAKVNCTPHNHYLQLL